MINRLLATIAPHYCYGCQKAGAVLCDNCKYDIIDEGFSACLVCAKPTNEGICAVCKTSYQKAWCVGDRQGVLERVINAMKFDRVKDGAGTLASLLDACLPILPAETIIVPVPTVQAHIRQRGYDHTLLIARELGKRRNLAVKSFIERTNNNTQRGRTKSERFKQAKSSFECRQTLPQVPYLLIDDVVTTNATLRYAAQALRDSGADTVWVGVVARQGLDKSK